jgi:hypothetical protein
VDTNLLKGCRFVALRSASKGPELPHRLKQHYVSTSAAHKPQAIVALLLELCAPRTEANTLEEDSEHRGSTVHKASAAEAQVTEASATQARAVEASAAEASVSKGCLPAIRGLVFAASVESTHRLSGFLRGCRDILDIEVLELTSRLEHKAQAAACKSFRRARRACVLQALFSNTLGPLIIRALDIFLGYVRPYLMDLFIPES